MSSDINGHTNGHSVDQNLGALESPTKPWYLSTKAILRIVNKCAKAIESNDKHGFDQSIYSLSNVIHVIEQKTSSRYLVINLESVHDLNEKLDERRSDLFESRNDGLDALRGKLAATLKRLIASVSDQKLMAADYLSSRANGLTVVTSRPQIALDSLPSVPSIPAMPSVPITDLDGASLYQRSMAYLQPLLEQVKLRYPQAFDKLATAVQQLQQEVETKREQVVSVVNSYQSAFCGLLQRVDNQIVIKSVQLLQNAQPYAHSAYIAAAPRVTAAMERARPYLEPLLVRVQEARAALEHHTSMGPYVTQSLERLQVAIELAKLYCTIGDPPLAVSAGLTGVPPNPAPSLPAAPPLPPSAMKKGTGLVSGVKSGAEGVSGNGSMNGTPRSAAAPARSVVLPPAPMT